MRNHTLKQGDIVIFSKTPPMSYLSTGEEYLVELVGKNEVYFRSVQRGSGTSDPHWAVDRAEFTVKVQA